MNTNDTPGRVWPFAQPLEDDYLIQCERDARRFSGAYTGTSGTLAAHVMRLLAERRRLLVALDEALKKLEPAPQYWTQPHD